MADEMKTDRGSMHKWYVVHVLSTHEKKVKRALDEFRESTGMNDFIGEVLVPIENVLEVKRGEQKVTEKRLWPGYIMVQMTLTDESWMFVKNTSGVIDFLGGDKPAPLSNEEVEALMEDLASKKDKVTQKHLFQVGDTIKIVDGVFVNFVGDVIEVFSDKGQLSAMISIFGRETRVDDLEFWQVEAVQPDTEEV
ncbi:MAG: transcriptional antiterminator NusG [Chlamydiales bacterium]